MTKCKKVKPSKHSWKSICQTPAVLSILWKQVGKQLRISHVLRIYYFQSFFAPFIDDLYTLMMLKAALKIFAFK